MDVIIFGGSGFVGQHLAKFLEDRGHTVWIASRWKQEVRYGKAVSYEPQHLLPILENRQQEYCIINLAGQSINSGRWTQSRKEAILDSRVLLTHQITEAIAQVKQKPQVLINASAIGYYGYSDEKIFTEGDPNGKGFLANVTRQWEKTADQAATYTRVALARLGVVLGRDGGAFPHMIAPHRFYVGGKIGSGNQWLSWIHIDDVCGMFYHCMQNETIKGAFNVTSPNPVKMDTFGMELSKILKKPHWVPTPSFVLQVLLGEMSEIILQGHRVLPEKIQRDGYTFKYEIISSALRDLLS